ncbi:UDP-N-acetylmuramate--L-alanine ligase [Candidatus Roizmanbacteria bacterium CG22_combo_CG10-13_8_21_14_all_38_20]|uniref:UDP-N-acetylmuramate--L-alanine ligase n=1 Tax=Candidatus Roizmanbacteria bacterium CG22_combo_CG10-13_8_21_14_all_38_20 TaxID=1974862 RepID=A0A2H0BW39_9BACT|nr:UDP-N-acetylmuramate--L-alanine ligase [Candidatus Microgenomates bacterium]PIP61895.1 MAG: UDP-N-acetylmuramate--L-alanine ligase [Candidatus Roizmanbacteria bacterium CG22_combo_CG10-13_8_21_14_all_38_20]PJC32130.1 MAG: UDP-N-acetylmuramate--L-alanine ligase [Candidatus Roizmanbacteria bacterium CG_4_9_14_0_2_um_filter_38_17]
MDLSKIKHIHFVGIKGVGMTSLAVLAHEMKKKVTGSDVLEEFVTDKVLKDLKIEVFGEFNGENFKKLLTRYSPPELLVVTTGAHQGFNNLEVQHAKELGFKVVSHAQALGILSMHKNVIAVAGTHGKSTTTAMIAHVLTEAGTDPSYLVGVGSIPSLPNPGHHGKGNLFVVEADEYVTDPQTDPTPRFLWLKPKILVITSVEYDHPDVYSDVYKLVQAFRELAEKVPIDGTIIACIDNLGVEKALEGSKAKIIWYGFSPRADYRIKSYYPTLLSGGQVVLEFCVEHQKRELFCTQLAVSGRHNSLNALACIIACVEVGVSWTKAPEYLRSFTGTGRRFELKGQQGETVLYDDYAHHPTEIKAVLAMAKELYVGYHIIAIFQPHTYSRTKALFKDFAKSFTDANETYLLDIFSSAREKKDPSISSQELAKEASKHGAQVKYVRSVLEMVNRIKSKLGSKQVIITMGAGDVYKIHDKLKV